jgi:two-component system sensor histidine kinase YesM
LIVRVFAAILDRMKRIFRIKTLKFKLILSYIFIVAFSTVLIGMGAYNKASGSLEAAAEQHVAQSLVQISGSLDSFTKEMNRISFALNGNQTLVDILKKDDPIYDIDDVRDYKEIQDIIYNITEYDYDLTGCTIFALDGRNFSMNSKSVSLEYDFRKENWVETLKEKKYYFMPSHYQTYLLPANNQKAVSLVKPLRDPAKGNIIGYVIIDYGTKFIEEILRNKIATQSSDIFIMDQDGQIIYAKGDRGYADARRIASAHIRHDRLDKLTAVKMQLNDEKIILSYYKSSNNNWTVVQTVPLDEIYRDIADIRDFTVKIIIAGLLFTVAVSLFLAFSISRPISMLQKNMKKVEQGNFDISVHTDSTDEIAQLQNSFYRMAEKIEEMIEKNYKVELLRKEAEIMAIQSQINPHFLCNTLSIIDSMAVIKGNIDVSRMCQALNKLFRYNIDFKKYSTLGQEAEQIKLYLYIQAVRYDNRLDYAINVPEELAGCKIMKLLIQPIVENVILHVVEKRKGAYRLEISAEKNAGGDVEIKIKDNGQGIPEARQQEIREELQSAGDLYSGTNEKNGYHIGLKNVHYRLKQNYGGRYGLTILSGRNMGTTVTIVIPFIS